MSDDPATRLESGGCGAVGVAALGSTLIASVLITVGMWAEFAWSLWFVIWVVTFFVTLLIGLPLYAVAAASHRINALTAAAAGAITAVTFPAFAILPNLRQQAGDGLLILLAFAACGALCGLIFFLLLDWVKLRPAQRHGILSGSAAALAVALAASWFAQDHSCHNPVWYGRGVASSASFRIAVPKEQWREVTAEFDRFARDHGWSFRADATFQPEQPWYRTSVCRPDGTVIQLSHGGSDGAGFEANVYQPQGGDGWRAPMRDLHARFQARWRGKIDYYETLGARTQTPPDWLRAPPAAPK